MKQPLEDRDSGPRLGSTDSVIIGSRVNCNVIMLSVITRTLTSSGEYGYQS